MIDTRVLLFKIIAALVIFGCAIVGASASRALRSSGAAGWLSVGNCFAGGVFVGAGLIHTLADSAGLFSALMPSVNFPVWAAIAGFAIVGLMWIDQAFSGRSGDAGGAGDFGESSDHGHLRDRSDLDDLGDLGAPDTPSGNSASGFTLFVVLSIHSLIAGMALGVEPHPLQAVAILLAIVAHKGTAAFALGLRTSPTNYWRRMAPFACMTPLGVVLGALVAFLLQGAAEQTFEAVFDAMAAGTFLYVALAEILPKELESTAHPQRCLASACIGLGVMAGLAIYT